MHANSGATRDCRLYDICDPWYGERGAPFVRKFKPSFVNGLVLHPFILCHVRVSLSQHRISHGDVCSSSVHVHVHARGRREDRRPSAGGRATRRHAKRAVCHFSSVALVADVAVVVAGTRLSPCVGVERLQSCGEM